MLTVRVPFNQRWRRLQFGRFYVPFREYVEGPAELYVFHHPDRIVIYNQEIELVADYGKERAPAGNV